MNYTQFRGGGLYSSSQLNAISYCDQTNAEFSTHRSRVTQQTAGSNKKNGKSKNINEDVKALLNH